MSPHGSRQPVDGTRPLQSLEEGDQQRVDGVRTLALDPMPGALQDVAATQAG